MADDGYVLSASDVLKLRKIVKLVERGEIDSRRQMMRPYYEVDRIIWGALDSQAAATTLLGSAKSATLKVYTFATSTGGTTYSGRDETVWNLAPQAATTDRWTVCERCNMSGRWIITTQFCS